MQDTGSITKLLNRASEGSREALDELLPLVYDELRRVAARKLAAERADHTLQPTALVNEAYLVMINQHSVDWRNRVHFFAIASEVMRRILVNHAVARRAQKRGSGETLVAIDDATSFPDPTGIDLGILDDALSRLARMDEEQAKIVELKFFGGLTNEEIAEYLGSSVSTIKREWASARAWLLTQLS